MEGSGVPDLATRVSFLEHWLPPDTIARWRRAGLAPFVPGGFPVMEGSALWKLLHLPLHFGHGDSCAFLYRLPIECSCVWRNPFEWPDPRHDLLEAERARVLKAAAATPRLAEPEPRDGSRPGTRRRTANARRRR